MKRVVRWWMLAVAGIAMTAAADGAIVLEGLKAVQQLESLTGVRPVTPKPANNEPEQGQAVDPAYADVIRLMNGDTLHGNLLGIDGQRGIRWRTPDAQTEIMFKPERVARIVLPVKSTPVPLSSNSCVVALSNGDELMGAIVAVDSERVMLETDYAGMLTFPRKRVAALRMVRGTTGAIYEGPTGMGEWRSRTSRNNWRFQDNSLVATGNGSIGRDVKLPPMARLEFDMAWRGQLQFLLGLYTDSTEEYASNSYLLQMQPGYIYLQRMRRNGGSSHMGQAEYPGLHQKSKVHVEVLVNKEARTIALLLDGSMVKQWKDNLDWGGSGTGIIFGNQNIGLLRISNIRVTEWDGTIQEQGTVQAKTQRDVLELTNKDKISGNLESMKNGMLVFVTAFAKMEIPVDRMQTLEFASEPLEMTPKNPADVRLVFADRGVVTMLIERWDGLQLAAKSSNFGDARFKTTAFRQLYFNWEQQKQEIKGPNMMFGSDDGEVPE